MYIFSVEYKVFYEVFREKFNKEYNGGVYPKGNIDSPKVWDARSKKNTDDYIILTEFAGKRANADTRYFYRKASELNPENKKGGIVDDLTMVKAFSFIGITPLQEVANFNKKKDSDKAKILLSQFQIDYKDQIVKEREKYDSPQDEAILSEENGFLETQNSNLTAAKYSVQRFYENIACGNFQDAWDLMSPDLQKRRPWLGNFETFLKGYTNTNTLRNIVVFSINQSVPNIIDCRVFYDDEIAAYTTKELSAFDTLTVDDIDAFAAQVKKLLKDFESKGLEGFEKIELYKLFEPSASEYIWYKSNYDPGKLHELFPVQKAIVVKRVYDCSCGYYNDKWLINSINAMKTFSAR